MNKLDWQYSRNQQRHWVTDGELYRYGKPDTHGHSLFEIRSNRTMDRIRSNRDIYRLIHKGIEVSFHKKPKFLKEVAQRIHDKSKSA